MKRNMLAILLFLFVFTVSACIPVAVPVNSTSAGYGDGYGYGNQYGQGYDDQYVNPPVTYGEPCYYAPPIAVTFPYDYFTYELVGAFVDIVFWRGGYRYHHEPLMDHGRRVSNAYIRSGQYRHPVRGSELNLHRERLQQNHNIFHPDSYYGVKSRPKQQMQQNLQQTGQRPQWGQQPQQAGQKPQLGQQPQQTRQRPQWGQQQPQQGTLRQTPQQTRQRYQQEQQKLQQERQKKIKERLKKPEQKQEQGQGE